MSTHKPSRPDPFYLAFSRKLVLLVLLVIASAMGLVVLLLQFSISIPLLAFLLTDGLIGLVAGFSVRWIIRRKNLLLLVCLSAAFITGGLALLGWFTGSRYGIDLFRPGYTRVDGWQIGQVCLATGFAFLALLAWRQPARRPAPAARTKAARTTSQIRRTPQPRPDQAPAPQPASPPVSQVVEPLSRTIIAEPVKSKRRRASRSKPKLFLSDQEEHRCPYCLELIDPDDPRGVVECEICHTLHHADCWAITGACQVPHFTA
jgi:hypothetical protein